MINIKIKSKSIFAVTLILALFLCIGLVSASDLSTDIDTTSNSNDVKVVETNYMDDNVAESEDSASANDNSQTIGEMGNFTSLNQTINSGEDTIVLDRDYEFNNVTDAAFIKSGGIHITKDITIDGQDHWIDCKGMVRFIISDGYTLTLKNINIQSGYVPKSTSVANDCGGAVFIKNANGNFENCLFRYCYAYNRGGAVAIINGNGTFTGDNGNVGFAENKASYAAAVDIMNGNGNFNNIFFSMNNALDYAGAVRISNGNGIFNDSRFNNNICNETGVGGALYFSNNVNATIAITNCEFNGNKAKNGGAIYITSGKRDSVIKIDNSEFIGNFAEAAGGAVVISNTIGHFNNTVFENNSGNYKGGAVDWESSTGYFENCEFTHNFLNDESPFRNYSSTSQKIGGAIYIGGSNEDIINLNNCTFKSNNASLHYGFGGAIALIKGNLTKDYDTSFYQNNTLGDVVYTNGIYNGNGSYDQRFANITLTLPTGSLQYGIFVPINVDIPCIIEDIPRVGRVTVTHENRIIYTKYINETTNGTSFDILLDYLPIGEHNYTITFEGPNFDKMSQNFTLNIAENTHNYNFNIANITYGDNLTINVVDGTEHLDYGDIYVIVGTELYIGQVYNGTIAVPYTIPAGNYQGFIFLDPVYFQKTPTKSYAVTVAKKAITGTATAQPISYGENAVVNVILSDLLDTLVSIQVDSQTFYGVITNGTGNITVSGLAAGSRNLSVRMVDPSFDATIPDVTVHVTPASTEIDMGPATFVINYAGTYTIKVLNVTTGVVNVTLAGKDLGTFKIADGVATISLTAAQLKAAGAGSKIISVLYEGDKNHKESSGSAKLTINKEVSKFTNVKTTASAYKSTAKSMKLTATLKDSKNKVIKNQAVIFKVNNRKSFSVKTNAKGVATLTLNAAKIKQCKLNKKGNYKFTVTYKTTATYKQATGTGKIKVTK